MTIVMTILMRNPDAYCNPLSNCLSKQNLPEHRNFNLFLISL